MKQAVGRALRRLHPGRAMLRPLRSLSRRERINFLLTNRIPRKALTHFVGRLSRIEKPWLARLLIGIWRAFAEDLDFGEAEAQSFGSMHAAFTRRLKPGARPVDARPEVVASPCDAVIGECGPIVGTTVFQAKGFPYELGELIPDPALQDTFRNGRYVTLRLRSGMYHRFHAPADCSVRDISYISGDTWNVNPIALKRIEKLFCRNERAVVPLHGLATAGSICLVPVAAILVASMRFTGLPHELDLKYRGPNRIDWQSRFKKGDEMGYFQQGSTILVFATGNYELAGGVAAGALIRMGQALLADAGAAALPAAVTSTGAVA
jgi:phosphatidylserine decarboxylase